MEPPKLLTVDEVAALLHRSRAAIHYMRQQGTGPRSAILAGRIFFKESDVMAWIDEQFAKEAS